MRSRSLALPTYITVAVMILFFTKFEPFGWTAMVVAGICGYLWFRRAPVPAVLRRFSIAWALSYTVFLFPILTFLLERWFTQSPFVNHAVIALVNTLASIPLGALTALVSAQSYVDAPLALPDV